MCKRLVCSMCFVMVLCLCGSTHAATLIAQWRLDGDATDSVGGINGTLMNAPSFTTDAMEGNQALVLDASSSQYVDFGNPQVLPAGRSPRSMTGWGKTDTVAGGWRWIAAYGSAGTNLAMFIGLNGTSLYGGGYGNDVLKTGFWEVDVWHHICLTYDGNVAKLYADGIEVDSQTKGWNLTRGRAHIGRQVNDAAEFWDGVVDDVRIYDGALTPAEIRKLAGLAKATQPSPADGAIHPDTWVNLSWTPGGYAVSHDVYLGESFEDVSNGTGGTLRGNQAATFYVAGFPGFAYPEGLIPGTTYYWRIDEVNEAHSDSPWIGDVWSFTVPPRKAYNPNPADSARYVSLAPTLNWTPGFGAKLHTVYFGDTFDEVNNASQGAPVATTTYVPGTLELDTTYYWRVDEFDGATTYRGDVWSFKTLPDIPIQDPTLLCWWKLDEGQGTTVLDWSGYGHHGTFMGDPKWVAGYDGGALEFDGSDDYVNFANTMDLPAGASARSLTGWGKTDSVAGGWRWIAAYGSAGTGLATFIGMNGTDLYGGGYGDDVMLSGFWELDTWHHISLTYDGTRAILYADGTEVASEAKSWNTTLGRAHIGRQVNDLVEFWDGSIDDVRIYNRVLTPEEIQEVMRGDPFLAWGPNPADGSNPDIETALPLSWSPGDKASEHDIFFGTDKDAVTDADVDDTTGVYRSRQSATTYTPPEGVKWGGGPYYWRIDEVHTDGTISTGRVWGFTVADFILVDDFESYTDDDAAGEAIWQNWIDGFGVADNGAQVGYLLPPYAEQTIVHSGDQSIPLLYNNTSGVTNSEALLTLAAPRDWTRHGLTNLSLWFRGYPASVGYFIEAPAGTYTMRGSGTDIWGTADEFHYAYKMLTGAGSIIARVDIVENTDPWAKAGVMIRETLDADSAHAFACMTPGNGVAFQGRYTAGGTSFNTNQTGLYAPRWVRLQRDVAGNFSMSHSANGTTWEPIPNATPESIPMSSTVYIGLALTSHNNTVACEAVFSSVTMTGTVSGQWLHQDIGITSNATEPLYVAIANKTGTPGIVAHEGKNAATLDTWTEWVIPLQAFADQGINLADVDRIAIGLGAKAGIAGPGGAGTMYFDDIRLYP